jgi:hypothetical protein
VHMYGCDGYGKRILGPEWMLDITIYTYDECCGDGVNTKIWYRRESDLWAQLGKKSRPENEGFFTKIRQRCSRSAVLLPFGKGTVCANFAGSHGDVARAEGMNGWISIHIWELI